MAEAIAFTETAENFSWNPMTHKEIVRNAQIWLLRSKGCNPVFTELGSNHLSEMPDVIGWDGSDCYMIECKASVADFNADKNKPHRIDDSGLGNKRFYCMTKEVYDKVRDNIPEGWGHLIADQIRCCYQERLKGSGEFKRNFDKEVMYLRSRILQAQRFGRD